MSDSEKEEAGRASPIPGRHEKSLGLLTTKFVEMLKNAEGGLLDLKKVCHLYITFLCTLTNTQQSQKLTCAHVT